MELEQMRQLDAIARRGTISAAAEELHLSQPALSRSIRRLERTTPPRSTMPDAWPSITRATSCATSA